MNKYVMIPVKQYERYKGFMKSSNEKIKDKNDSRQDSEMITTLLMIFLRKKILIKIKKEHLLKNK